jgi:phosphoribosylformylglycinamidine (FGAM) synthase PurS component
MRSAALVFPASIPSDRARSSTSILETSDRAKAEAELKAMGEKLLANTVIEDFAVEVL